MCWEWAGSVVSSDVGFFGGGLDLRIMPPIVRIM